MKIQERQEETRRVSEYFQALKEEKDELMHMFRDQGQEKSVLKQENQEIKRQLSQLLERQEADRRIREEYEKIKSNVIASRQDELKKFSELFTDILTETNIGQRYPGFHLTERAKKPRSEEEQRRFGSQTVGSKAQQEFRPIIRNEISRENQRAMESSESHLGDSQERERVDGEKAKRRRSSELRNEEEEKETPKSQKDRKTEGIGRKSGENGRDKPKPDTMPLSLSKEGTHPPLWKTGTKGKEESS